MTFEALKLAQSFIVYDSDRLSSPVPEWFDPGAQTGSSQSGRRIAGVGREPVSIIDTACGPGVLKRYLRGGLAARFSRRSYLFTGFRRSRSVREFHLLNEMLEEGLPVPRPLAALCSRAGLMCTMGLITTLIPNAHTLADELDPATEHSLNTRHWREAGTVIARFHRAGIRHADLNLKNILVDKDGSVFLVDFDKSDRRNGSEVAGIHRWQRNNMKRLQRSFEKLSGAAESEGQSGATGAARNAAWSALADAYKGMNP